jgi:hypothetical protein
MRALVNAYLLLFIPFMMLCLIKGLSGQWIDIIMSTDWSVASFIIFAQSLGTITKTVVKTNHNIDGDVLTSYIIKVLILGIVPSLYLYFIMNTTPTLWAACGQLIMFAYASWRFFIDGRKVQILSNMTD